MRTFAILATVAALAAPMASVPTYSLAQEYRDYGGGDICHEEKRENANTGTVVGAVVGAVIGSQVAGHHDRAAGAVVGAGAGALVGRQIGKSTVNCKGYPSGYRRHGENCRWVEERHEHRIKEFEVCKNRRGEWVPTGRR